MSKVFSSTANKNGIIQQLEDECGFNDGDISGNTVRLQKFTADVNLALDDFFALGIQASGTWQFDDSNHTKYPVVYTNLVANQRDYSFTTDEQSNLILDIYEVAILPSATATLYQSLNPIDELRRDQFLDYDTVTETTNSSVPYSYGKLANGIFLESKPSYSATNGLKIYVNREGSYFAYTDSTKRPGVPGLFHEYFAIFPAMKYAQRNGLSNAISLERRVNNMRTEITKYFSKREKDVRHIMSGKKISYI